MGLLDTIKRILNKNKKEKNTNENIEEIKEEMNFLEKAEDTLLNFTEIVQITTDGILDTHSQEALEKFKHNLEVLIKKAKENKKIDQFMIIRDDDFFPYDWEWRVSSKETSFEKVNIPFSFELKEQYAKEKAGLIKTLNGINVPISEGQIKEAVSKVDKDFAAVYLPVRFRSTKHFTVNTPLEYTFDYNQVEANRNFTILDNITPFLDSSYGYSLAYHDAYLDVSHEALPISKEAIVLIEKKKYEKICKDVKVMEQLKARKVVIYEGEESLAVNMLLTEHGILPSKINEKYAVYDNELNAILENSIKDLAQKNHLLYDQAHGGKNGHFTDLLDRKNKDFIGELNTFAAFLRKNFTEYEKEITDNALNDPNSSRRIIQKIGVDVLCKALKVYNQKMEEEIQKRQVNYKNERKALSADISSFFKTTFLRINEYYNKSEKGKYSIEIQNQIEKQICDFYQKSTVQEQLIAAKNLWKIIKVSFDYESFKEENNKEMPEGFHR